VTQPRGRVLALDLGDVRIGLAVSDELWIVAQPAGILKRTRDRADLAAIARLVAEHGVSSVVVGYPLLLSGEEGERARMARETADRLRESLAVPVELWDERLTTAQAERALIADGVRRQRRRQVVDSLAAVLILQSWLDSRGQTFQA
jgi:putative Holliday junction resolvase